MPKYFFSIYDGIASPDGEGQELSDAKEARLEAVRLAGAVIRDEAKKLALKEAWRLEVTDENRQLVLKLDFVISESRPASAQTKMGDS